MSYKELEAAQKNLFVDQGDSYYKEFTLRDSAGVALNLTGYTISGSIKRYANTNQVIALNCSILNPLTGSIAISIDEVDTAKLIFERYVYEVKVSLADDVIKVLYGQILINPF